MLEPNSPIELEDRVELLEEVEEVVVKMSDADDWFLESLVVSFDADGESVKNLEEEIVVPVNKWFGSDENGHKDVKTERSVFQKGERLLLHPCSVFTIDES